MMQCHWTKQRLKTLLLFLCIRTKEGPTEEKNIPRKCNLQVATLSLPPTKGRAHLFKRKSALFEFESSSSRTKNRSAPHFSFPRKPEGEFKKNNNFFLLALYGKNKVGKNFSSCIEYGGGLSTWEEEGEEEEKTHFFSLFSP